MIGKPKPVKAKRKKAKRGNARKELEKRLEAVIRELVWWRDNGTCVEADRDGGRCGGPNQWGHILPRSRSSWLKFTIANTAVQCGHHNLLHAMGDPTMFLVIGEARMSLLQEAAMAHRNEKPSVEDLKARLYLYQKLLDWRPTIYTKEDLIAGGYYD